MADGEFESAEARVVLARAELALKKRQLFRALGGFAASCAGATVMANEVSRTVDTAPIYPYLAFSAGMAAAGASFYFLYQAMRVSNGEHGVTDLYIKQKIAEAEVALNDRYFDDDPEEY